jgi:zinc protease
LRGDFEYQRLVLDNGLVLLAHENPRIPLISLNVYFKLGKDQNPVGAPGTSALTARLLDEGTEKLNSTQISEVVESMGAQLSCFSERELTGICLLVRAAELRKSVDLLSQMVRSPAFPEERFQVERMKILNHVRSMQDDPQVVASQMLNQWIYQNTPLADPVLGYPESLKRLGVEDIRAFHRAKFAPQDCLLVAVGDFHLADLAAFAEEGFGSWKNPEYSAPPVTGFHRLGQPVVDCRRMDKEQVAIIVGHLGTVRNNPDFYALQTMDVILGQGPGFTSRIPRNLRDEQGLAYAAFADISGSCGVYPGRFVGYISTSAEQTGEVVSKLVGIIEELQETGISDEELRMAQDYLTGSFVFEFQSNQSISRFLLTSEVFSLGPNYAREYAESILNVTKDQVIRVARGYLDTINYVSIFVGAI